MTTNIFHAKKWQSAKSARRFIWRMGWEGQAEPTLVEDLTDSKKLKP